MAFAPNRYLRFTSMGALWLSSVVAAHANISLSVSSTDLPLGATATIQLYLEPAAGATAGVGATLLYEPEDFVASFAGSVAAPLGGPEAVHMSFGEPGRMVFAAARPQLTGHTPAAPERFALARLRRTSVNRTTVVVSNMFTAAAGGGFNDLPAVDIIFGLISADSDGDEIADSWEYHFFNNLSTAGAGTDYDGDGESDLNEFLNGHHPLIAYLTAPLQIDGITAQDGSTPFAIQFPTESGVRYRLVHANRLIGGMWQAQPFSDRPEGPYTQEEVTGSGGVDTLYFQRTTATPLYLRIEALEE